jgi:hypothetical protein
MQPELQTLAAVPLFTSLSPSELESVAGWTEARRARAGDRLCGGIVLLPG